jgi:hypothetical protein
MVVQILDIIPEADTWEQGSALLPRLIEAMSEGVTFQVSFQGITTATSSFTNASFVALLDRFPLRTIKDRMMIVDSTHQINDMIRHRLNYVASSFVHA